MAKSVDAREASRIDEALRLRPVVRREPGVGEERASDKALAADLRDLLANDVRTRHLRLAVEGRGGVAHVEGTSAPRRSVGSSAGSSAASRVSHAVCGLLSLPGERLAVVDLGSARRKQVAGAIGIDRESSPRVDLVADLERGVPLDDDSVDHVFAVHVLEHVANLVELMNDLHRVLRPTGVLHALAPNWRFVNAVADPTHCRLFDVQTFKWFCDEERGVQAWRRLMAGASDSTVYADLQPVKDGRPPDHERLARWFS